MDRITKSTLSAALGFAIVGLAGCGERTPATAAPEAVPPAETAAPSQPPPAEAESPAPAEKAADSDTPEMDPNMDHSQMPMEPKK